MQMGRTMEEIPSQLMSADRELIIWVAEDNSDDQMLLDLAARDSVLTARFRYFDNGLPLVEALTELSSTDERPDLLILDLRMPGIDGHRTLELLDAQSWMSSIPVVVFSSSTTVMDQARSFARGALWYETKPSAFPDLVAFVTSLGKRIRLSEHRQQLPAELREFALTDDIVDEIDSIVGPNDQGP